MHLIYCYLMGFFHPSPVGLVCLYENGKDMKRVFTSSLVQRPSMDSLPFITRSLKIILTFILVFVVPHLIFLRQLWCHVHFKIRITSKFWQPPQAGQLFCSSCLLLGNSQWLILVSFAKKKKIDLCLYFFFGAFLVSCAYFIVRKTFALCVSVSEVLAKC